MQKTKSMPELKNRLRIDSSHKIPPPMVTRKFRHNRCETNISRDIWKKRNYASKSKTIWELILLIKYLPLCKSQKFRQNRRKTIISRDICRKWNYGPKSITFWGLLLFIKYHPVWWPENFVKIAVKPLFHEIYAKNEIMARNQKPFGNWFFS